MSIRQNANARASRRLVAAALLAGSGAAPAAAQEFDIDETTIASVHAAFAAGSLTCRQLVEGYIDRIEAFDDEGVALNAILMVNPDALAIADEMDAAYAADPASVGSLHCVPVILKDNCHIPHDCRAAS